MRELNEHDILLVLELIERSEFDFLQLEVGDLKLTVSKRDISREGVQNALTVQPMVQEQATTQISPQPAVTLVQSESQVRPAEPQQLRGGIPLAEGMVPITAPMVGIFYAQSEPGAPPFVQNGSSVDEDTTVGLIEMMKLFSSIRAGVRGVISEILVQNAQFVEYGQSLFLVKPGEDSKDGQRTLE